MVSSNVKKFFVLVCVVLALAATIGMTPVVQRRNLLKPITSLYTTEDEAEDLQMLDELSQGEKVIVKPDGAKKESLNLKIDKDHDDQLLPATTNQLMIDGVGLEETQINDDKIEEILNAAPLL